MVHICTRTVHNTIHNLNLTVSCFGRISVWIANPYLAYVWWWIIWLAISGFRLVRLPVRHWACVKSCDNEPEIMVHCSCQIMIGIPACEYLPLQIEKWGGHCALFVAVLCSLHSIANTSLHEFMCYGICRRKPEGSHKACLNNQLCTEKWGGFRKCIHAESVKKSITGKPFAKLKPCVVSEKTWNKLKVAPWYILYIASAVGEKTHLGTKWCWVVKKSSL